MTFILELKADMLVTQIKVYRDWVSCLIFQHQLKNVLLASIQQKQTAKLKEKNQSYNQR